VVAVPGRAGYSDMSGGAEVTIDPEALKRWTGTGLVWTPFPISISWLEVGAILMLIQEFKIRSFFELGTNRGGLASILFLRARFDKLRYNGIEIEEKFCDTAIYGEVFPKFNLRVGDAFENMDWIKTCLTPSPACIFCDGGNKQKEIDIASGFINSSDFILGHDYMNEWLTIPVGFKKVERWYLQNTTLCLMSRKML